MSELNFTGEWKTEDGHLVVITHKDPTDGKWVGQVKINSLPMTFKWNTEGNASFKAWNLKQRRLNGEQEWKEELRYAYE